MLEFKKQISSDTTNFILKIVFVILSIVILYIIIRRHPGFIEWIRGLTTGTKAAAVTDTITDSRGVSILQSKYG